MITLSEPCRALAEADPLTVGKDDLVRDIADQIKNVHYRAVVAVDRDGKPVGVVTRSDLVNPEPRRVLLVDHGERAQSVPGIEEAEIVEILDHHHIGSIETKLPVTAIFDPVGSTATLVTERFRQGDSEPTDPTATMLLGAIVSDTVLLTSPTTTERDRQATHYLEWLLSLDAQQFGREMFEHSSDVADVSASDLVRRDLKEYELDNGKTLSVAQIETVGRAVFERSEELLASAERRRARHRPRAVRGHADRHPRAAHAPARGRQRGDRRARVRRAGRRRGDRAARRHEPQEAGRAGVAGGGERLTEIGLRREAKEYQHLARRMTAVLSALQVVNGDALVEIRSVCALVANLLAQPRPKGDLGEDLHNLGSAQPGAGVIRFSAHDRASTLPFLTVLEAAGAMTTGSWCRRASQRAARCP